jgi:hypothetical protein
MEVYLPVRGCCFQPLLHLAMASLLVDGDGQEIRGDVLVNFDSERLSDSQTCCTAQNKRPASDGPRA